jgi:hypothetical protein
MDIFREDLPKRMRWAQEEAIAGEITTILEHLPLTDYFKRIFRFFMSNVLCFRFCD